MPVPRQCDSFLEAFSSHARAQISAQNQSLASQQELLGLLESTIHQQVQGGCSSPPLGPCGCSRSPDLGDDALSRSATARGWRLPPPVPFSLTPPVPQASLAAESQLFRELADIAFANLQEEQRVLDDEVRAVPGGQWCFGYRGQPGCQPCPFLP